MNRHQALEFIRDNSRLICSVLTNPVAKPDQWSGYEPMYLEKRLGDNATPFIIFDMGTHGWELYIIAGENNVDKTLVKFSEATGCALPETP